MNEDFADTQSKEIRKDNTVAGEIAQQLGALASFPEDPGLNGLQTSVSLVPESLTLSPVF